MYMCRLFFFWNESQPVLSKHIIRFLEQSVHDSRNTPGIEGDDYHTHLDGYGIAGFRPETGRWSIYKSPDVYHIDSKYSRVLDHFSTFPFVVGHIRNATEQSTIHPINTYENTHPFYYKNQVFMHNGKIQDFQAKRHIIIGAIDTDLQKQIRGNTDTELLFYLFLSNIREYSNHSTYSETGILQHALLMTLEFLQKHFHLVLCNIIYANKTHALCTRYIYEKNARRRREPPSLYWNMTTNSDELRSLEFPRIPSTPKGTCVTSSPKYFAHSNINKHTNHQKKWVITSEPIVHTQTLVPQNTLGILEIKSGVMSISSL